MKTSIIFFIIFINQLNLFGQDSRVNDSILLENENWIWDTLLYGNTKFENWDIDFQGNLITSESDVLRKYDAKHSLMRTQSIKQNGHIDQLFVQTGFKVYLFHSDQQVISILDNTLSNQDATIDLSDYNIIQAVKICPSVQQEKIWVFDQVNSNLHFLSTNNQTSQLISNLTMVIGNAEVLEMREIGYNLFVYLSNNTTLIFDRFGTFLKSISGYDSKLICGLEKNNLLVLSANNDFVVYGEDGKQTIGRLSSEIHVTKIFVQSNLLYYSTAEGIFSIQR